MRKIFLTFCLICFTTYTYSSLDERLKAMTLEEKIGQLLIVHFHGETVNEEARFLIEEMHIGGIIYYNWANGLSSPEQVQNLSNGLQKCAQDKHLGIPLFISTDQEGGRVTRLKEGFTVFPGNGALGQIDDTDLTEQCAYVMGKEMRAVGVNLNFSPVVDVNCNPSNPVIGTRSFGSSPELVTAHAQAAMNGYAHAGIISTLKHFPGHGDVIVDSHEHLPVIAKSLEELERMELFPYRQLANRADMIMTGHLLVSAIDPEHCVTLSQKILVDLLRESLSFKGVIVSDSLIMQGLLERCPSLEQACVQALSAGCDLLILGGRQLIGSHEGHELGIEDIKSIHNALIAAVQSKILSEERIDASLKRILQLKQRLAFEFPSEEQITLHVHTEENQRLADTVAKRLENLTQSISQRERASYRHQREMMLEQ